MSASAAPRLLWSWAGLPNVLLVVLPLAALSIQMRYRIPSRYVSGVLPWIGVALSALSLLFFLNRLMAHSGVGGLRTTAERFERWSFGASLVSFVLAFMAPAWLGSPGLFPILLWGAVGTASAALLVYACRVTATALSGSLTSSFRWLERATLLLVLVFVGHGAVTLVNGALDFSAPIEAKAQVVAIEGVEVDLGRFVAVSWADLRSWRAEGIERIFLLERERRRMWPGQAVLVSVHPGALGIPWVSRVIRDDEVYFRQILEVAPTATAPLKHLITFYLERQRWEDATAVAVEYLKRYPDDYGYIGDIAARLAAARRTKETLALLESFEKVIEERPSYPEVQQQLHQLRQQLGQPELVATPTRSAL
ncbi:MAG TPA: hypothetical protein VN646_22445 [Candidatus Acidoferrum sp.]|jgi:hypothetical protein|nr:hypothetical protein [Candidatus Acidoferrum sp.]